MSHGHCPNCKQKLEQFSGGMLHFPFKITCPSCNAELKLRSYRSLVSLFISYVTMFTIAIFSIPQISEHNLGIVLAIGGWFITFHFAIDKILNKDNLIQTN